MTRSLGTALILVLQLVAVYQAGTLAGLLDEEASWFFVHPFLPDGRTPASYGLAFDEIAVPHVVDTPAGDQTNLRGWWTRTPNEPRRGVMLMFHGNLGNIEIMLPRIQPIHAVGLDVVLVAYPGFDVGYRPNEEDFRKGTAATIRWLASQVDHDELLVTMGHSWGGAMALLAATESPRVDGVFLESTYSSMADMILVDSFTPWGYLGLGPYTFDNRDLVRAVNVPILNIHGTRDEMMPLWMPKSLLDADPDGIEQHILDCSHALCSVQAESYHPLLDRWLDTLHQ